MLPREEQLQRLMAAAAQVRPPAVEDLPPAPDAGWLLRQRQRELARSQRAVRSVLRAALATACLFLMVTLLLGLRQVERTHQDVFGASELVLTRVSAP